MSDFVDGYNWTFVDLLKVGDIISWWGFQCPVLNLEHKGSTVLVTLLDPLDQKVKTFDYAHDDTLIAKRPA